MSINGWRGSTIIYAGATGIMVMMVTNVAFVESSFHLRDLLRLAVNA